MTYDKGYEDGYFGRTLKYLENAEYKQGYETGAKDWLWENGWDDDDDLDNNAIYLEDDFYEDDVW